MWLSKKAEQVQRRNAVVVPETTQGHPAWQRLEDQVIWYDSASGRCQRWYKSLKIGQVLLAVLIPVLSQLPPEQVRWATASAGSIIALLEAVQHMNQYSTLWVMYRSTTERLKHEKFLFLSAAGPYKSLGDMERFVLLAERVEEQVSAEHANWFNDAQRGISKKRDEES